MSYECIDLNADCQAQFAHALSEIGPICIAPADIAAKRDSRSTDPAEKQSRNLTEMPFRPFLRLKADQGQEIVRAIAAKLFPYDAITNGRLVTFSAVLANLQAAHANIQRVHYSRDNNYYTKEAERLPVGYQPRFAIRCIDQMAKLNWIGSDKTAPGTANKFRSSMWMLPKLKALLKGARAQFGEQRDNPAIVLRSGGEDIFVKASKLTRRWHREMEAINKALIQLELSIDHPQVTRDGNILFVRRSGSNKCAIINTDNVSLTRIFNNDWDNGGRLYRHWVQNLTGAIREHLLINGMPTVELDYSSLHPRLLFALCGIDPAILDNGFDSYAITGIDSQLTRYVDSEDSREPAKQIRCIFKLAVMILINANNQRAAIGGIVQMLAEKRGAQRGKARIAKGKAFRHFYAGDATDQQIARLIIEAIKAHLPDLKDDWHSGAGLMLQRADSDLAVRVLLRLLAIGITAIPVHDSFIVQAQHHDTLNEVMQEELEATCAALKAEGLKYRGSPSAKGHAKSLAIVINQPAAMPEISPDPYSCNDTDELPADWDLETDIQIQFDRDNATHWDKELDCDYPTPDDADGLEMPLDWKLDDYEAARETLTNWCKQLAGKPLVMPDGSIWYLQ
jgi:hypothetical protein